MIVLSVLGGGSPIRDTGAAAWGRFWEGLVKPARSHLQQ